MYFGKWRDASGRQVKRRLGPAWVVADGVGGGGRGAAHRSTVRSTSGRRCVALAAAIERARGRALCRRARARSRRSRTRSTAGCTTRSSSRASSPRRSPTTATCSPRRARRRGERGRPPSSPDHARVRRPLPLASITAADVGRYLASLDAEPSVGPRTVNKHRQVLCSRVRARDARGHVRAAGRTRRGDRQAPRARRHSRSTSTSPRRCSRSCARRERGLHRDPSRPAVSPEEHAERDRCDEQDAAIFVVAAFAGLRMGELLALRWRNVDFARRARSSSRRAGPPAS